MCPNPASVNGKTTLGLVIICTLRAGASPFLPVRYTIMFVSRAIIPENRENGKLKTFFVRFFGGFFVFGRFSARREFKTSLEVLFREH